MIDIRGEDLSDINVINIIKGLYEPHLPISQRLLSDENSDVLFYFTGHSGEEFFKIQDSQVLYSRDIGNALDIMNLKGKYRKLLFISDTCEAFSWFSYVGADNIMYEASSGVGESAFSYGWDNQLLLFVSDKYSYILIQYLKDKLINNFKSHSILSFFESFDKSFLESEPVYNHTLTDSKLEHEPFINFFPPPFTAESSSLFPDVQRYSVFERVAKVFNEKDFEIAASFIDNL